jgi:hypothetical protein
MVDWGVMGEAVVVIGVMVFGRSHFQMWNRDGEGGQE